MNKKNSINVITNLIAMTLTLLINFAVTPIIINGLGVAAYSYVSIITNIISFLTVITYTLNSMVGRFYTVSYNTDKKLCNQYISSALIACIALGIILFPIIWVITINLDKFIIIIPELANDVKIAFLLSCISFLLNSVYAVYLTGAYCKNRLEIINFINIFTNIIRLVLIIILFRIFLARIWYIGLSTIIQTCICIVLGFIAFKKLIPEVEFSTKYFNIECTKDLLSAGLFNSIIMMGTNLMTQIDILVANRLIKDADLIGKYAIVLLFSSTLRNISSALSSAFSPTTLIIYTNGNEKDLAIHSNSVVNFCGLALGWPISIIAAVGTSFLSIWLTEDFSDFKYLIVLMMLPMVANLAISQLNVVNQAVNKLKFPAMISIIAGVLNLIMAVVLAQSIGIWGIALASVLAFSLRNILIIPIYVAYVTKQKLFTYYEGLFKPLLISSITCGFGILLQYVIKVDSFLKFLEVCSILSLAYVTLVLFVIGKDNRSKFMLYTKEKIQKVFVKL